MRKVLETPASVAKYERSYGVVLSRMLDSFNINKRSRVLHGRKLDPKKRYVLRLYERR